VVDLVGYRRFGHNEQDEPAYTQPLMAQLIAHHPTVRERFAERLADEGIVSPEDATALDQRVETTLKEAHERLKSTFGHDEPSHAEPGPASSNGTVTAVPAE